MINKYTTEDFNIYIKDYRRSIRHDITRAIRSYRIMKSFDFKFDFVIKKFIKEKLADYKVNKWSTDVQILSKLFKSLLRAKTITPEEIDFHLDKFSKEGYDSSEN